MRNTKITYNNDNETFIVKSNEAIQQGKIKEFLSLLVKKDVVTVVSEWDYRANLISLKVDEKDVWAELSENDSELKEPLSKVKSRHQKIMQLLWKGELPE